MQMMTSDDDIDDRWRRNGGTRWSRQSMSSKVVINGLVKSSKIVAIDEFEGNFQWMVWSMNPKAAYERGQATSSIEGGDRWRQLGDDINRMWRSKKAIGGLNHCSCLDGQIMISKDL